MRPPEEQSDFKGLISSDLAAGLGAFRADGRCGRGLGAGSSFAPAAGGVLGPDHDLGERSHRWVQRSPFRGSVSSGRRLERQLVRLCLDSSVPTCLHSAQAYSSWD